MTARIFHQPDQDGPVMGPRIIHRSLMYEGSYKGRTLQVHDVGRLTPGLSGTYVIVDPSMVHPDGASGTLGAWTSSSIGLMPYPMHKDGPVAADAAEANLFVWIEKACRVSGQLDDEGWLDLPGHPKLAREMAEEDERRGKATERARDYDVDPADTEPGA